MTVVLNITMTETLPFTFAGRTGREQILLILFFLDEQDTTERGNLGTYYGLYSRIFLERANYFFCMLYF